MKLYIISDSKYIKIGISKHPEKRLKQLQTAQPKPLILLFEKELKEARKVEKYLHRILWQFKAKYKSEWFLLPEVDWLFDYINEIS